MERYDDLVPNGVVEEIDIPPTGGPFGQARTAYRLIVEGEEIAYAESWERGGGKELAKLFAAQYGPSQN